MRIEYELKFRDYLLFNVMHQLLSVPVQLLYGGFATFIFFSYLGNESWYVSAIAAILAYLVMWAVQLSFNVFYLYFGRNRSLLTKHIVEIQDDAFYEETQFNRSYHFWPGIAKVISRPGFMAVYINGSAAHILPGRAFSSPEHRQEFMSALKGQLDAV
jgi:hypothetical protein